MVILNSEIVDGIIKVNKSDIEQITSKKSLLYDKNGEEHYNIISALHKSLRNSDPDAGIYWLARMLEAGEDPLYVARRLIRFASEDVGLADPNALGLATSAYDACHDIGMPECALALTEVVVYLALSPKSNSLEVAYNSAKEDALHNVYVLGTNYKVISTTAADKYNILINQDNGQFENYSDLLLQDLSSFNECWEFNEDSIIFKPINKD